MTKKAGGNESMYVSEEDDDQKDREFWRCYACPLYESCKKSKNSFKNSCCYSYVNEETCREYVHRHLMYSGTHKDDKLTEDDANALAQGAEIGLSFETYAERVEYRAGLDLKPPEPEFPPSNLQRKRQRDDDEPPFTRAAAIGAAPRTKAPGATPPVEALGVMVGQLANALQAAGCGSSSGSGLQASNNAALALRRGPNAQGVELVTESMNRILESIGHATSQCISTARTLNEEGQRLRAAAVAIEEAMKRA
jgi:hypothetical protein